jgi:hypothetical protein
MKWTVFDLLFAVLRPNSFIPWFRVHVCVTLATFKHNSERSGGGCTVLVWSSLHERDCEN